MVSSSTTKQKTPWPRKLGIDALRNLAMAFGPWAENRIDLPQEVRGKLPIRKN